MSPEHFIPNIFQDLSAEDRDLIKSKLTLGHYHEGEVLFSEGDLGDNMIFIMKGRVKISKTSQEGRELLITYAGEGEFFGELSVLTGQRRSATVTVTEALTVQVMSKADFLVCLARPDFSRVFMTALAWRLHESSERFSDLVLYNIYRNVLETLRRLAQPIMIDGVERLVIENRPTHQEIAALLGSSREVITRTLRHLQRDGLLHIEGKRVVIFSPDQAS